jgi:hypothetical protein
MIFKLSQNHPGFLSPILLSLSPWRLWREHLIKHLVVSGSCHFSLGVLSKEEKTNKKGFKFLSGARAKGGKGRLFITNLSGLNVVNNETETLPVWYLFCRDLMTPL